MHGMGSSQLSTDPWLKVGKHKLPITVERHQVEDSGTFTGGGRKTLWHTTEGGTVDSVVQTLIAKRAGVHFVIDPASGRTVQLIPFGRAGRGLEHVYPPETNRANAIQIEIVGFAAHSAEFDYRHLAGLALAIERHHGTPRRVRNFTRPIKLDADAFVAYAGHCGHCHVPGNSHWDPGTGFKGQVLRREMGKLDA
jgi:hypothetical protein